MGVPTSEVGYTAAMPRREDHEVHTHTWWHWTKKIVLVTPFVNHLVRSYSLFTMCFLFRVFIVCILLLVLVAPVLASIQIITIVMFIISLFSPRNAALLF